MIIFQYIFTVVTTSRVHHPISIPNGEGYAVVSPIDVWSVTLCLLLRLMLLVLLLLLRRLRTGRALLLLMRQRNLLLLLLPSVNHYSFHHKVIKYKYYLREIRLLFGFDDSAGDNNDYTLHEQIIVSFRCDNDSSNGQGLLLLRTVLLYTSICHHQHCS